MFGTKLTAQLNQHRLINSIYSPNKTTETKKKRKTLKHLIINGQPDIVMEIVL